MVSLVYAGDLHKPLKVLWQYLDQTYFKWWWLACGSLIGSYELAARMVPEAGMPSLDAYLWWIAVPLFVFAPFPLYLKLRRQLKQVHDDDWKRSFSALLEMKYGKMSSFSIEEQLTSAEKEFERFEAEILRGDFRHKEEFLAYKDILLGVLARISGSSSGPYGQYQKRSVIIVEAINKHEEENKDKDSGL